MLSMISSLVAPFWILLGPLAVVALMTRVISGIVKLRRISLNGKVVLITGASSGIGESVAAEFYRRGAKVILSSRRQSELNRVMESLINSEQSDAYPPAILIMDVSDLDSIPAKVEEAYRIHGRIDIVVNSAGVLSRAEVIESSLSVYQEVMQVNYFGVVALTMAVLPRMIQNKRGHIVAISSVQGRMAIPRRSAYAASKHAVVAFMDSLRAEVADAGIYVTSIHPGYVKTNIAHVSLTAQGDAYGQEDPNIEQGIISFLGR
uniref:Dehydrogenase/reductase SDR family protein 7-like n=2 Tax=Lygus hesperus TaxID=30085 RepID=A0A0A9X3K5_LYGHE